jgi:hypothetical protein
MGPPHGPWAVLRMSQWPNNSRATTLADGS